MTNLQSHEMGITQNQQAPPAYGSDNKTLASPQTSAQPQQDIQPQQQQMAYTQPGAAGAVRIAIPLDRLGDDPQDIDCPVCHQQTRSRVESHASSMTILTGVLIGILCICLACVPCIAHWSYDNEWFCGSCGAKLAYKMHDSSPMVCYSQGVNTTGPAVGAYQAQQQPQIQQPQIQQPQIQQPQIQQPQIEQPQIQQPQIQQPQIQQSQIEQPQIQQPQIQQQYVQQQTQGQEYGQAPQAPPKQ